MNNISAWAGVLTYSPFALPSHLFLIQGSGHNNEQWLKSLQLRDSYGFITVFPFNSFTIINRMKPKAKQK